MAVVFRIISEVHSDEGCLRVAQHDVYHLGKQLFARGKLAAIKAPFRVHRQLRITLVVRGGRPEKRRRIAHMEPDGNAELPAFGPDWIKARIIKADEAPGLVLVHQAQGLEALQPARAQPVRLFQVRHCLLGKLGIVDFGKVHVGKDRKAPRRDFVVQLYLALQLLSESAAQIDHLHDAVLIHDLHRPSHGSF